jgi:glucose-fructose oxidoreductase
MIETARQHDVRLMIAYRLHFEAGNLAAIDLVQSGQLGEPRIFSADFTMQVRDEKNIRLSAPLGGGTLYDIGIYCINAARYLFRSEPNEVWAWASRKNEERFSEVEEMVSAILRFPENRVATFTCSFGAAYVSSYRVIGTNGDLRVEPAFDYADEIVHHVKIGKRSRVKRFAKRDQFAAELDHFALCIRDGTEPATGGIEGLNDVRIIEMLYESAHKGVPIALTLPEPEVRPGPSSNIQRPPVKKPQLVRANGPSGGNE